LFEPTKSTRRFRSRHRYLIRHSQNWGQFRLSPIFAPPQRRICGMNNKQQNAKAKLQDELKSKRGITKPLPNLGENDKGYFFTEVAGVTVLLGPRGGYLVPSLPSYPDPLDAAVNADNKWKAHNPDPSCGTGHCNPVVKIDWFCVGSRNCPCKDESPNQRFRRSIGRIGYG